MILAGGLSESNVLDALKIEGVIGVDVSSGLEIDAKLTPGKKDLGKLKSYVRKIRSAR